MPIPKHQKYRDSSNCVPTISTKLNVTPNILITDAREAEEGHERIAKSSQEASFSIVTVRWGAEEQGNIWRELTVWFLESQINSPVGLQNTFWRIYPTLECRWWLSWAVTTTQTRPSWTDTTAASLPQNSSSGVCKWTCKQRHFEKKPKSIKFSWLCDFNDFKSPKSRTYEAAQDCHQTGSLFYKEWAKFHKTRRKRLLAAYKNLL